MNSQPLDELEGYATARELCKWVVVVCSLGVENRRSRRERVIRGVVVTDDEVNTLISGIANFFCGLDACIYRYDEPDA